MKRFSLILALVLMAVMPTFAERVNSETAQKVATTFLNNNGAKSAQLTDLSLEAGFPNLYIFNAEPGFVVMATDDCVQPILGYSLTGKFVAKDMPDNVRCWLQGYNDEIQYAIDQQLEATAETVQLWKDLMEGNSKAARATVVVAPLIQTKWNQNKYYNNLCPEMQGGSNGHAYTGCTATAMAQVIKYYNYPSKGIGSHSYSWNEQILSADFGATYYDWDNMADYYEYYYDDNGTLHWLSAPSSVEIDAVATLMYHCGVSVDMNYRPNGSGASIYDAANALKNYFNYSSSTEYKIKSDYDDAVWKTMVKGELNENRPLEYAGYDPNGSGGHAFVCDGYNSNDYFHFNWGWAGNYNGYFSLNNLNTGANNQSGQGNGVYTRDQEAIFGIQPTPCTASDPTNLTYTLTGQHDVILDWTAANGAVSYNIYRNNSYVGNSATNSYTETMPFGTNVYYVRSVDANGCLSLSSNYVTITVDYLTPIVDDLEATLSGNNINLSWTAPEWCYPATESAKLNYGEGNPYYLWTSVYYAHRHLAANLAQYAGKAVYKVSTYIQYPGTYSVYIYTKSTQYNKPDPSHLAFSNTGIQITLSNDWYEFNTNVPIILTGTDDLWVVIKQENTGQTYAVPSFELSEHNINAFYAGSSPTNLYDCNSGYNCAWLINTYLTDGTYTYNLYRNGSPLALDWASTSYTDSNRNNTVSYYTVKTNYYGGVTDASNGVGYTLGQALISSLTLNGNDLMTVSPGSKLTVSGQLSSANNNNLVLENGAQLVNNSNNVHATVKKNISAYTGSQNNNWHLVASPISNNLSASATGLLSNNFDLYTFNQSADLEWRNYEAQSFSINNKNGYLYANSGNPTLIFQGTLAGSTTSTQLVYDNTATFKGFNLIGNPYPCNTNVNRSFYVMNEDGSDFILGSNPVAPCAAILVQAQGASQSVTFSKNTSKGQPDISISVTKSNMGGDAIIDRVRVSFNENDRLSKYTMNPKKDMLYIPQNGNDFAVAYADGESEMPINFKTTEDGTYTLHVEAESLAPAYLHVIDDVTGTDIDLLATPSYTFEAKTTDSASRFRLMFAPDKTDGE